MARSTLSFLWLVLATLSWAGLAYIDAPDDACDVTVAGDAVDPTDDQAVVAGDDELADVAAEVSRRARADLSRLEPDDAGVVSSEALGDVYDDWTLERGPDKLDRTCRVCHVDELGRLRDEPLRPRPVDTGDAP